MANAILINPNYYGPIFRNSPVRRAISRHTPPLGLLSVAAPLVEKNHNVKILDLNAQNAGSLTLENELREFQPDILGITATTPLVYDAYEIAHRAKTIYPRVPVVAGGPHPSARPKELLTESDIDYVVVGEGDYALLEILEQGSAERFHNVYSKKGQDIVPPVKERFQVEDLDALPFTPYELLDIKRYRQPRTTSRSNPVGYLETSRGCYGRCIYCNKNISGWKMRFKSPLRVVAEIERLLASGIREIHIVDDCFTADMQRAYQICEEILKRGLKFPWYPRGGLRVDRVNPQLLKKMRQAGCYRVPFGVESGSQRILDLVKKGINLDQAEAAVHMAKEAHLEVECYFMLGLPTETASDIRASLAFALRNEPDYIKFAFTVPLPGTEYFANLARENRIKTNDWRKFNFSTRPRELFEHDTLSWQELERYERWVYRRFFLRIPYIWKMVVNTLRNGTFPEHLWAFVRTKW